MAGTGYGTHCLSAPAAPGASPGSSHPVVHRLHESSRSAAAGSGRRAARSQFQRRPSPRGARANLTRLPPGRRFPCLRACPGDRPAESARLARRTALFLAAAGLAAAICFWLLAPWLIPFLYGPGFAASVPVLRILGLSTMPAFVNYSFTHYLIARGRQGVLGFFTGAMLLVHAVLSWVLIPRLGAVGPALSVVLAECLLLICCLGALRLAAPAVIDDASPTPADSDSARAPAAI
jgi:hypothetical protein